MTEIRKHRWGGAMQISAEPAKAKSKPAEGKSRFYPKNRARLNKVPGPEELSHLINQALTALGRGVYWDRGSILNILT